MNRPQLLAPAGNLRALETALRFGADAVYCGLQEFSLRASAHNLNQEELSRAAALCHKEGKCLYLTLNIFAFDSDLDRMVETARIARDLGVDAVIVSDLGAIARIAREVPGLSIHVSTQANITNTADAEVYRSLGASRVIVARELSLDAIKRMVTNLSGNMEVECFVHGAICMSFSGRCLLSRYLNGRSANRGACTQPCRWSYTLHEAKHPETVMPIIENEHGTAILSSGDLCMIEHIPELIASGVSCLKIEGRMKNELYVATVTRAYRAALDACFDHPEWKTMPEKLVREGMEELCTISHRSYDTGFFFGEPQAIVEDNITKQSREYMGYVLDVKDGKALVEMRNRFFQGEELEALTPSGIRPFPVENLVREATGESISVINIPLDHVWIPSEGIGPGDLLRGPVRNRLNT